MTKLANYGLHHRKEAILMIAEEVFAQYSFERATIRLITKRSGVNSAMISYYFGSKESLYLNIFMLRLQEITEDISRFERLDLNSAGKLKAYLTAYIERVASNQSFYRLLSNELVTVHHPTIIALVSETRNRIYNFLLQLIADGIAQGYFKKTDQEVFALNVLALVRSVVTDQLTVDIHLNKHPKEDFASRIVDYIMSMITPEDQIIERKNHV